MKTREVPQINVKHRPMAKKKWSLGRALIILGADPREVYWSFQMSGNSVPVLPNNRKSRRTIYREKDPEDMRDLVNCLYKKAVVRFHPDKHKPRMNRFYTAKMQEVNEAYRVARRLLMRHGA